MLLSELPAVERKRRLAGEGLVLRTGPIVFCIRSPLPQVDQGLAQLYANYPLPDAGTFVDFTLQLDHPPGHPQLVTVDNYEEMVLNDLKKQEPHLGAKGRVAELSGDDKYIGEKQLAVIALNEELSEHISYNRTIPDARNPKCRTVEFDVNSLPTVTVIIIFFNEPYSVLVRTVHSVINTSPPNLLKEVVLVNDSSTNEELKGKLDHYVNTRLSSKVKLLRLRNR